MSIERFSPGKGEMGVISTKLERILEERRIENAKKGLEFDENFEEMVLGMEYTFKQLTKKIGKQLAKSKRKIEKMGANSSEIDEMCKEFDGLPREVPNGLGNVAMHDWLKPKLKILRELESKLQNLIA